VLGKLIVKPSPLVNFSALVPLVVPTAFGVLLVLPLGKL